MEILTYDEIDLLQALEISLLASDFPLTPEYAAHLRQTDPRPFPFLRLYAVEEEKAVAQLGVICQVLVSKDGRETAGGIRGVGYFPDHKGRGAALLLMEEAHARMRDAGIRFSVLVSDRSQLDHCLYRNHGYQDMKVWGSDLARWETAHQPTRLRAGQMPSGGYDEVEALFEFFALGRLGYAWRHSPYTPLHDRVSLEDIWILWGNEQPAGYALTRMARSILHITDLVLAPGVSAAEAVAALTACLTSSYIQATVYRPSDIDSLQSAGYRVIRSTRRAFMIKSLIPEIDAEVARRLFGIGTDQFLISWLDFESDW